MKKEQERIKEELIWIREKKAKEYKIENDDWFMNEAKKEKVKKFKESLGIKIFIHGHSHLNEEFSLEPNAYHGSGEDCHTRNPDIITNNLLEYQGSVLSYIILKKDKTIERRLNAKNMPNSQDDYLGTTEMMFKLDNKKNKYVIHYSIYGDEIFE